jgi:hypothetical protein
MHAWWLWDDLISKYPLQTLYLLAQRRFALLLENYLEVDTPMLAVLQENKGILRGNNISK